MIENYTNCGRVRESRPYDFRIVFNAIFCKMTHRIWFSTYLWPLYKIDGIMAVFSLKKVDIIENNRNGGVVREFPPYDFLIIFNATSCKMIQRISQIFHLLLTAWQNWQNYGKLCQLLCRKTCRDSANFDLRSKVSGKSFLRIISRKVTLKIIQKL